MDKNFNSKEIESRWSKYWEDEDLFAPSGTGEPYSIVIPPPNVTGTLHMGHAFLNTIIDTLIRYQRMNGKNVLWQMGTDHAGIATQMVVERRLAAQGKDKRDMGRDKFLAEVWKWKDMSSGTIEKQLRRLGASVDWKTSRFTMDDAYINSVIEAFVRLHEKGLVYRSKRLVNWDPVLQTAVSDLEVRAVEEPSTLYYIRYPFVDDEKSCMVISTTRPETTLADGAVAVHPDDERYKESVGRMVRVPGTDRIIPVIADEYVKPDFGSGCVKITPAHDFNDYEVGQRHTMETINLFTKDAHLNENAPPAYRGMDRYEARTKIVQDFKQQGLLAKEEKHSYSPPRGDRSGVILEPYLTDQWFIKMDTMAQRAIKAVKDGETKFVSPMWEKVYYNWLNEIQDWCVSRQLWWGHRIPAWYDEDGKPYVGRSQEEVRAKHNLDSSIKLRQDEDVLDTWFSSALWTFATMGWPLHESGGKENNRQQTFNPTDLLVTGFDIIFFWVARMIMATLCLKDEVPFRNVYIHGLVRDGEGQKMSKSKGNILDPLDIIDGVELEELLRKRTTDMMQPDKAKSIAAATKKHFPDGIAEHGTDALRFTFCAMASTGRDLNFDTSRCIGYRNFCNKLWNATRYVLMQCTDADRMAAAEKPAGTPNIIDQYMQWRFEVVTAEIRNSLDNYRIDLAAQSLYEFVWHEFCDWYIEFTKPILASDDEQAKASVKQGLLSMLDNILHLAHPFIPFITEETWQHLHAGNKSKSVKSIMVSQFPHYAPKSAEEINEGNKKFAAVAWMKEFIQGVRVLRSELNIAPNISLELILVSTDKNEKKWLKEYADIIKPIIKCNKLSTLTERTKPPAIARSAGKGEVLMPITANNRPGINREEEEKRLRKKLTIAEENIVKLNNKLNNKGFTNKAPDNIVTGVKIKLKEQEDAWNKISTQRIDFIDALDSLDKDNSIADILKKAWHTPKNHADMIKEAWQTSKNVADMVMEAWQTPINYADMHKKILQAQNNHADMLKGVYQAQKNAADIHKKILQAQKNPADILKKILQAQNNHADMLKKAYQAPKNAADIHNKIFQAQKNATDILNKIFQAQKNAVDIHKKTLQAQKNVADMLNKSSLAPMNQADILKKSTHTHSNDADFYYNQGLAKYTSNEYREAIDGFTKAIKIKPNHVKAYYNRATTKSQLKNYKGAIEDFTKTINIKSNHANAYYNRAIAKSRLKNYKGAIDDFTKVTKIEPNDSIAYYNRGNVKSQLKDYKGAIDDYNKAIEIEPNHTSAYYNCGNAKRQLKDYQGAIDDYNRAIKIEPNNAVAYYNRGNIKSQLNDYQGAINDFTKAIKIEPSNTAAYYNRGNTKNQLNDYQGAIDDYTKAIKIEPNNANYYYNRASTKSQLKDYKGAIKDFTQSIDINPKNADTYNDRGGVKNELRDYKGAINDFNKAININPNYAYPYYNLGIIKTKLKDYNSAIDYLTKAIKINPKHAHPYYNLGIIKTKLKDYNSAIDYFTQSIKIDIKNVNAYYNRGNAKLKLKNYMGAIDDYTDVIKIDPKNVNAYNNRGMTKYQLKNYKGAINDLSQAINIEPKLVEAYNNRGNIKNQLHDYKGAIDDFTSIIEIDLNDVDAYYNRGNAKLKLNNYQSAVDDYTNVININPKYIGAYINRGAANSKLEDYEGAINDYTNAIKIKPKLAVGYNNRGSAKAKLKDYRGAIDDFTNAIKIEPNNADTHSNRGKIKTQLKDYKGAIDDYTNAINFNPNNADIYNNRGATKFELKEYQGALDDYNKAIELASNNAVAYYNRGEVKDKLKDYKGAIKDCQQVIELTGGRDLIDEEIKVRKLAQELLKKLKSKEIKGNS